jgi:hypothetical protein
VRAIRDIRDRYDFRDEFKFSKITRGSFSIYCELIDALEGSDARIAATVVDRVVGADPFKGDSPSWVAHARVTSRLLVGIINRRELACALIDEVSTPRGYAFDDTVRGMVNRRMKATALVSAACLDSRCNDGLQLADLIAGAVAHQRGQENMTASATSHKGKVAARLATAFGVNSFGNDVRSSRVNVATFTSRVTQNPQRVSSVGT